MVVLVEVVLVILAVLAEVMVVPPKLCPTVPNCSTHLHLRTLLNPIGQAMSAVGLKQDSDEIVRSLGDILLNLGCDTGWLVPNTSLNASTLNARIAQYQKHLDTMELEIEAALIEANRRATAPEASEAPVKEEPAPSTDEPKQEVDLTFDDGLFGDNEDFTKDNNGLDGLDNGMDNGMDYNMMDDFF